MSPRMALVQKEESLEREFSWKTGVEFGSISSDDNISVKILTDEQFDQAMEKFAKRLESHCTEAVMQHAKKLRPNYDGAWIVNLKAQLQHFERHLREGSVVTSSQKS